MRTVAFPLVGAGGEPVDLARTLASHGFVDLPPMRPGPDPRSLEITLPTGRGRPRTVRIHPGPNGQGAMTVLGPAPSPAALDRLAEAVRHVLHLGADLSPFYAMAADDPDLAWATAGAGRMVRSPTVFEDVVKTICTTNCAWSAMRRMVHALVEHLGVGPYAAAHIMMTLARYHRLILDSWTRPTYARKVGRRRVSDRDILRRFRRYGPYAGLAFWLFCTRDWVD